jgi:hypothetical protein
LTAPVYKCQTFPRRRFSWIDDDGKSFGKGARAYSQEEWCQRGDTKAIETTTFQEKEVSHQAVSISVIKGEERGSQGT